MRCERGQATVEWTAAILLVALLLGALATAVPIVDGRSFGGFLAHSIVCAARGGCHDGDRQLRAAYGARDAELVRELAPGLVYEPGERSLPVDFRRCREPACALAPDDRDLDVLRSDRGRRATAFTQLIHRDGQTFVQYWLYYPTSRSTVAGSDRLWRYSPAARLATRAVTGRWDYPGYHRDDWESYEVRIDRRGRAFARASSHGHYQGCKERRCRGRWTRSTRWTRVSRGSHAGHIPLGHRDRPRYPGHDLRERTTSAAGLRLVPISPEVIRAYRPLDRKISPPWRKGVYGEPLQGSS